MEGQTPSPITSFSYSKIKDYWECVMVAFSSDGVSSDADTLSHHALLLLENKSLLGMCHGVAFFQIKWRNGSLTYGLFLLLTLLGEKKHPSSTWLWRALLVLYKHHALLLCVYTDYFTQSLKHQTRDNMSFFWILLWKKSVGKLMISGLPQCSSP
jgi:hypothetical protein